MLRPYPRYGGGNPGPHAAPVVGQPPLPRPGKGLTLAGRLTCGALFLVKCFQRRGGRVEASLPEDLDGLGSCLSPPPRPGPRLSPAARPSARPAAKRLARYHSEKVIARSQRCADCWGGASCSWSRGASSAAAAAWKPCSLRTLMSSAPRSTRPTARPSACPTAFPSANRLARYHSRNHHGLAPFR